MDKEDLRKKLKIKRKYFQNYQRSTADNMILENFMAEYGGFDSFFIYNSTGSEAGTSQIIAELLKSDKRVFLPRVEGKKIVAVPYGKTIRGAYGIYEPVGEPFQGDIEVTVAPLLCINERGYRIGYGGGYYDGYFKNHKTLRVGAGYAFQTEDFEEDVWDERLDTFVTERGIYYFGNTK